MRVHKINNVNRVLDVVQGYDVSMEILALLLFSV